MRLCIRLRLCKVKSVSQSWHRSIRKARALIPFYDSPRQAHMYKPEECIRSHERIRCFPSIHEKETETLFPHRLQVRTGRFCPDHSWCSAARLQRLSIAGRSSSSVKKSQTSLQDVDIIAVLEPHKVHSNTEPQALPIASKRSCFPDHVRRRPGLGEAP